MPIDLTDALKDEFDLAVNAAHEDIDPEERYTNRELIEQGGMKRIYSAYDQACERQVVYTIPIKNASEKIIALFEKEARVTASLQHQAIIPVYDLGTEDDGTPYFIMKKLEGSNLQQMINKGTNYSIEEAVDITIQIAHAVSYAHSQGILHLDLKPENIHVNEFGEITLCDWGTAKVLLEECHENFLDFKQSADNVTLHGQLKGTPGYMAPEQFDSKADINKTADIYGLGTILFSLIAQKSPVIADTLEEYAAKTKDGKITAFESSKQVIPETIKAITMKALSLKPEDRYTTVQDFINDLNKYRTGYSVSARQSGPVEELILFYKRNRLFSNTLILSTMIIILVSLSFSNNLKEAQVKKEYAEKISELKEKQLAMEQKEKERLALVASFRKYQEARGLYMPPKENYTAAYPMLVEAVKMNPKNKDAWISKAAIELRNLEIEKAINSLENAREHKTNAVLIEILKRHQHAIENSKDPYRYCRDIFPEISPVAVSVIKRLFYLKLLDQKMTPEEHKNFIRVLISTVNKMPIDKVNFVMVDNKLTLVANKTRKLHYLPDLKNLPVESADFSYTNLVFIDILSKSNLKHLNLYKTKVKSITPLLGLGLETLYIPETMNNIKNISKIKTLKVLYIPKGMEKFDMIKKLPKRIKVVTID